MSNKNKSLWKFPWGYKESFLISAEVLLIGFIIEILTRGIGVKPISWPLNLITGIIFIGILVIIHLYGKKYQFVKWLSGIPAATGAICLFCLLSLLLGFIPQNTGSSNFLGLLGLNHVKNSWPMLLASFYLLTVLGLITLKRITPLNLKNTGFFLNHAGLWITIFAMSLGSGDLLRLKLKLTENKEPKDLVVDEKLKIYKLPFKVKLIDFEIEEYAPKIALIHNESMKIVKDATNNLTLIEKDLKLTINEFEVEIKDYLYSSKFQDSIYIESNEFGSGPSAYIVVKNTKTNILTEGWVAPAGLMFPVNLLHLDKKFSIGLTKPTAKVYSSLVEIIDDGSSDTVSIEVNKPHSVKGWKLYQLGYEEKMGRWSPISILETVYDPWLPVVYIGIFMLLAGGLYILWIGKDK